MINDPITDPFRDPNAVLTATHRVAKRGLEDVQEMIWLPNGLGVVLLGIRVEYVTTLIISRFTFSISIIPCNHSSIPTHPLFYLLLM